MTLTEVLADPTKKQAVIADSVKLIDSEMAAKRGLRAAALKAGYATVKAIKPGIIPAAVNALLPEFAPKVDPFYVQARESGDIHRFFCSHDDEIADALLLVTDTRAERAKNKVMLRVYRGLRGQAKTHVKQAIPGLAGLVQRHVS